MSVPQRRHDGPKASQLKTSRDMEGLVEKSQATIDAGTRMACRQIGKPSFLDPK